MREKIALFFRKAEEYIQIGIKYLKKASMILTTVKETGKELEDKLKDPNNPQK